MEKERRAGGNVYMKGEPEEGKEEAGKKDYTVLYPRFFRNDERFQEKTREYDN